MPLIKRFRVWLDLFEKGVTCTLLAGVTALIFFTVILRYFFGIGFAWGDEIARFMFIGMNYLALSRVAHTNTHIRVRVIQSILPYGEKPIEAFVEIVILFVVGYIAWVLVQFNAHLFVTNQLIASLAIPIAYFYIPVSLGFLLAWIRTLGHLYEIFLSPKTQTPKAATC